MHIEALLDHLLPKDSALLDQWKQHLDHRDELLRNLWAEVVASYRKNLPLRLNSTESELLTTLLAHLVHQGAAPLHLGSAGADNVLLGGFVSPKRPEDLLTAFAALEVVNPSFRVQSTKPSIQVVLSKIGLEYLNR